MNLKIYSVHFMPKDSRKRLVVALNLDENERKWLEKLAEEESRSVTQQIEHIIKYKIFSYQDLCVSFPRLHRMFLLKRQKPSLSDEQIKKVLDDEFPLDAHGNAAKNPTKKTRSAE